jgi:hypothetical protein
MATQKATKSTVLHVRVSLDLIRRIDKKAAEENRNRGNMLVVLAERALIAASAESQS